MSFPLFLLGDIAADFARERRHFRAITPLRTRAGHQLLTWKPAAMVAVRLSIVVCG